MAMSVLYPLWKIVNVTTPLTFCQIRRGASRGQAAAAAGVGGSRARAGQRWPPNLLNIVSEKYAKGPGQQAENAAPKQRCLRLGFVRSGSAPGPPKICLEDFYELGLGVW